MKHIRPYLAVVLLSVFAFACGENNDDDMNPDDMTEDFTIWEGDNITFTKADGADPNVEANQDRITSSVHITRGNNGGQIFNAATESSSDKDASPAGTEWAVGSIDDIANLTFRPFRAAVGDPKDVVGKNLVLHVIAQDVYISVRFTQWSQRRGGGFAYIRSTEN